MLSIIWRKNTSEDIDIFLLKSEEGRSKARYQTCPPCVDGTGHGRFECSSALGNPLSLPSSVEHHSSCLAGGSTASLTSYRCFYTTRLGNFMTCWVIYQRQGSLPAEHSCQPWGERECTSDSSRYRCRHSKIKSHSATEVLIMTRYRIIIQENPIFFYLLLRSNTLKTCNLMGLMSAFTVDEHFDVRWRFKKH